MLEKSLYSDTLFSLLCFCMISFCFFMDIVFLAWPRNSHIRVHRNCIKSFCPMVQGIFCTSSLHKLLASLFVRCVLASIYLNSYIAPSQCFHLNLVSNSAHLNLFLSWQPPRIFLLVIAPQFTSLWLEAAYSPCPESAPGMLLAMKKGCFDEICRIVAGILGTIQQFNVTMDIEADSKRFSNTTWHVLIQHDPKSKNYFDKMW